MGVTAVKVRAGRSPWGPSWPMQGQGSVLFTEIGGFGLLLHVPRARPAYGTYNKVTKYFLLKNVLPEKSKLSMLPWVFGFF